MCRRYEIFKKRIFSTTFFVPLVQYYFSNFSKFDTVSQPLILNFMANTYTQIYIHGVFSVQDRYCLISETWKDELFKYITGIVQKNGHKLIAINGMADHLHLFIGMKPSQSLSDLMQDIKGDSSKWINSKGFMRGRFSWQEGFGAFSYSASQIDGVVKYINNQEVHHKRKTFIDEYKDILKKFNINFDDKYLFKEID